MFSRYISFFKLSLAAISMSLRPPSFGLIMLALPMFVRICCDFQLVGIILAFILADLSKQL